MDELLGKLYDQYKDEFAMRVHLVNLNETVSAITNAVIGQRMKEM